MSSTKLKKLLESPLPWPEELEADTCYSRLHDDHDGTCEGELRLMFSRDGDAHVMVAPSGTSLRFRTAIGGGGSLRTRNALVILALAMKLDREAEQASLGRRQGSRK